MGLCNPGEPSSVRKPQECLPRWVMSFLRPLHGKALGELTAPYTLFLLPMEGSGPAVPHRWSTLLEAGQRGQDSVGWGLWRVLLFV